MVKGLTIRSLQNKKHFKLLKNKIALVLYITILSLLGNFKSLAQGTKDTLVTNLTLKECLAFALNNQQLLKQSILDEQITDRSVRANLSAWLPQIRAEYNYQHFFLLPFFISEVDGKTNKIQVGLPNQSNILFQADQVIFNNEVFFASKASRYSRLEAVQNIESTKINVVSNVSKAFYDILLTQEQLNILEEDILRLQRLLKDTYNQYLSGVIDKIDYKRTTITLNNVTAQKKRTLLSLQYKYAFLKQSMGYPNDKVLSVSFDTVGIKQQALIDTTETISLESRIEYKQLRTQLELQAINTRSFQWGYLPSVSAFVNYNKIYLNKDVANLYDSDNLTKYPTSAAGLKIAVPIFSGNRRIYNLQKARLQTKRATIDLDYAKQQINTQYEQAMSLYKSNLNEWKVQEENLQIAKEVYEVVKLQYDEGIKVYLDVITSETELRTSQLNYLNALYNLLSSKLDVQRALGTLSTSI